MGTYPKDEQEIVSPHAVEVDLMKHNRRMVWGTEAEGEGKDGPYASSLGDWKMSDTFKKTWTREKIHRWRVGVEEKYAECDAMKASH